MASFIIDKEIEEKEAFLATILDLQVKKYLRIDNTGVNNVNIVVINDKTEKLYSHEKYTLECLKNERDLDLFKFADCIRNDCKDAKFIIIRKTIWSKIFVVLIYIYIFLQFVCLILEKMNIVNFSFESALFITVLLPFFIYVGLLFVSPEKRTIKGINFAVEMQGLKNYLRDYTLINEKDIEYTQLADRYIAYAVALGEAEKIEDKYMISTMLENKYFGKR